MLLECLMSDIQRKSSMENYKRESALRMQKKRYKYTLNVSRKDFDIPMGSWELTAQEQSKWRGLINKEAAFYEKKENL